MARPRGTPVRQASANPAPQRHSVTALFCHSVVSRYPLRMRSMKVASTSAGGGSSTSGTSAKRVTSSQATSSPSTGSAPSQRTPPNVDRMRRSVVDIPPERDWTIPLDVVDCAPSAIDSAPNLRSMIQTRRHSAAREGPDIFYLSINWLTRGFAQFTGPSDLVNGDPPTRKASPSRFPTRRRVQRWKRPRR